MQYRYVLALAGSAIAAPAFGQITINFDTEDDGVTPLVNGQHIETDGANTEFGTLFDLTIPSDSDHAGGVIFNTNNPGPNAGGQDPDLLVGLGNALTLQEDNVTTQTVPGIFDTPNDAVGTGSYIFDFLVADVQLLSLTLIDINGGSGMEIILSDSAGLNRTYTVPQKWTFDISVAGPLGYGVLDLTTLADQNGEGTGGPATAIEDTGFNPFDVVQLRVNQTGSGAIDNLTFVPTPGAVALLVPGLLAATRRRR